MFHCRDPSVLSGCTFETEEEKHVLMMNIKHRLTPHPVKIRAGKYITMHAHDTRSVHMLENSHAAVRVQ